VARGWVHRLRLLLVFASVVILGSGSCGTRDHIYCLRFETPPTWRARSPYLYPPGTGWLQLYPQALGSLFVTSYNSQGNGWSVQYLYDMDCIEDTAFCNSFVVLCVFVTAETCLPIHCLETAIFCGSLFRLLGIGRAAKTHRQQGDLINLLLFFFRNKERRLIMGTVSNLCRVS
jgi:hypothetical protein